MTLRDITADEWLAVRTMRARRMTGFSVHRVPFSEPIVPPRTYSYYVWPMGKQPGQDMLNALMAGCPVKAAEKFLAIFKANKPCAGGMPNAFQQPVANAASTGEITQKGGT